MNNSNLMTLIKFNIKYYLLPRFADKKEKRKYIGIIILFAFAFIVPIGMLVATIYTSAASLTSELELAKMLSVLFVSSEIATLFFSLFSYLQIMYLSKDNEFLLSLPVRTVDIFIGKIVTTLLSQVLITAIILIPSMISIVLGVTKANLISLSAWFYIVFPIAIITLPFLPLMVIAIVSFPIMKIMTYLKKHPTLGAIISTALICAFIAAIYIPLYSTLYGPNSPIGEDGELAMDLSSIFGIGEKIPHTFWIAKAAMNISPALNLLFYILVAIAVFAIGILIANFLYKGFMYSANENSGIVRQVKKGEEFQILNTEKSLLKREFLVLTRDSQKFMNILMSVIMGPLMTAILIFVMKMAASSEPVDPETGEAFAFTAATFCGFASCFTIMMLGGSNVGASAGFSLEGPSFNILKTLPIKGSSVFKAKLKFNDILNIISICIVAVVMMIMIDGVNILDIVGLIVSSFLIVNSLDYYSLKRDLKNPKLNWTNIKEITKNNFSTLVPMLISLPAAFAGMIIGIVCEVVFYNLNRYLVSLIIWGTMIIIGLLYFIILRGGKIKLEEIDRIYEEIEA